MPTPRVVPVEEAHISIRDGKFHLDFKSAYTYDLVRQLQRQSSGRSYDEYTKVWWLDKTPENARALLNLGLTLSPEAGREIDELRTQADIKPEVTIDFYSESWKNKGKVHTEEGIAIRFSYGPNFEAIKNAVKAMPKPHRRYKDIPRQGRFWLVTPTKETAMAIHSLCQLYRYRITPDALAILKPLREQAIEDVRGLEARGAWD